MESAKKAVHISIWVFHFASKKHIIFSSALMLTLIHFSFPTQTNYRESARERAESKMNPFSSWKNIPLHCNVSYSYFIHFEMNWAIYTINKIINFEMLILQSKSEREKVKVKKYLIKWIRYVQDKHSIFFLTKPVVFTVRIQDKFRCAMSTTIMLIEDKISVFFCFYTISNCSLSIWG